MFQMYYAYFLRNLRRELRFSQDQMAELFGIKKSRYIRIELGKIAVKSEELHTFSQNIGISLTRITTLIEFMHDHKKTDVQFEITEPKYFGCLLPIPDLHQLTIDILNMSFDIKSHLKVKEQ